MKNPDERTRAHRAMWTNRGQARPDFAVEPGPGEESVWDYPRPPALVEDPRRVVVRVGEVILAQSEGCLRVLETASPPTVYLPPVSIDWSHLEPGSGQSHCEWKGMATYFDASVEGRALPQVAWAYPDPYPEFASLRDHLAFYPGRVECWLGGTRVAPQPGHFYGGWVTPEIVGPYKGERGTEGW